MVLLNNFNSISLQDHVSSGGSPLAIAKIPKSYVPSFTTPSVSLYKVTEKNDKEIEHSRTNIRASSVPPPRAVLSSPDNDGMIGNRNQLSGERSSTTKKFNTGEKTDSQRKVNTRIVKEKGPLNMRIESKESTINKSCLKGKEGPELNVPKRSGYLRKGRQRSTEKTSSAILSHSQVKV